MEHRPSLSPSQLLEPHSFIGGRCRCLRAVFVVALDVSHAPFKPLQTAGGGDPVFRGALSDPRCMEQIF